MFDDSMLVEVKRRFYKKYQKIIKKVSIWGATTLRTTQWTPSRPISDFSKEVTAAPILLVFSTPPWLFSFFQDSSYLQKLSRCWGKGLLLEQAVYWLLLSEALAEYQSSRRRGGFLEIFQNLSLKAVSWKSNLFYLNFPCGAAAPPD